MAGTPLSPLFELHLQFPLGYALYRSKLGWFFGQYIRDLLLRFATEPLKHLDAEKT